MSEPIPTWDHYRTFLSVLNHGSLSAAARDLGLTQPTVGRHIDALEQVSGAPLFLRTQIGLRPTDTALQMKPYAETMASTAASLVRTASGLAGTVTGTVRISASEIIGIEVLPPIIADLQDRHPQLSVELSIADAIEDLMRQEADIAVRMAAPAQGALVSRRIGMVALGFFAHRAYLDRHGTPETIEDLASHRLIGYDRQLAYIRTLLSGRPDLAALRFALRTDSNLAQLAAIRAGGGIGMCQVALARRDPELLPLLPGALDLPFETYVVMHENLKTAPRCRVTFDALVTGLLSHIAQGSDL